MSVDLRLGDCIEVMRFMPDDSVDSIVTDPPYELGFMGKSWDSTGVAFNVEVWREALRVLKPGGHLLAFSGSRTYHRMAVAIEDAGFEIRDQIMWIYGSGFPKSLNIGKHLDDWEGWGTALKPAHEPIVMARKPFKGTVANNVLAHGTGGLNIDESRVGTVDNLNGGAYAAKGIERNDGWGMQRGQAGIYEQPTGRWPANVIHDGSDEVLELFPLTTSGKMKQNISGGTFNVYGKQYPRNVETIGDSGSAARFFYCAKANKKDRNEGLEGFEGKEIGAKGHGLARFCAVCSTPQMQGCDCPDRTYINPTRANHHPTVKPTDLMRYLVTLVTPPDGTVLDPFMGSGSTGKACAIAGFDFIGIELNADYLEIAQARINYAGEQA